MILPVSWLLNYCHTCKILTWSINYFSSKSNINLYKIWIMSSWTWCHTGPCYLFHEYPEVMPELHSRYVYREPPVNKSFQIISPWTKWLPCCHFTDDIFRCNFVNEKFYILMKISPKFVPKSLTDNMPALVQEMAWCRIGDKPLSEPMLNQFTDAYMRH